MKGYTRYEKLVADWAGEYMRPFLDAKQKGEEASEQDHSFLNKLFYGFTEISGAIEALKLAEILISLSPPRSKRIKQDQYLKYHINAYLQEVYILKERLNSYATKLKRVYSKTNRADLVATKIDPLFDIVKKALDVIVDTRGSHVHSYRYSDKGLDRLSSLSLISQFKDEFQDDAKFEYKGVQYTWKRRVKENNEATMKLLDIYFDAIYEAVTQNGKVVVPNTALHPTSSVGG